MPGSRRVALLAAAMMLGTSACNEDLCTRSSECETGFVCTREAACEPAPDASGSPGGDGGAGGLDASAPDAGGDSGVPDAAVDIDAGDASPEIDASDDGLDL
jgi:hypothetical protein